MTVYSYMRAKNFTMIDNNVLRMHRDLLTDGAKVLYVFIGSLPNGKRISHKYIGKSLGYADGTIKKYVKQLKDLDLMCMQRHGAKEYSCYLGNTTIRASMVKEYWQELDSSDTRGPITKEQLENIRNNSEDEMNMLTEPDLHDSNPLQENPIDEDDEEIINPGEDIFGPSKEIK